MTVPRPWCWRERTRPPSCTVTESRFSRSAERTRTARARLIRASAMRRRESAASGMRARRRAGRVEWKIPVIGTRSKWRWRDRHGAKRATPSSSEVTKRPKGKPAGAGDASSKMLENLRPSDLAARFAILRHDLPQEGFPRGHSRRESLSPRRVGGGPGRPRGSARCAVVTIDGEDARDFADACIGSRAAGRRLIVAIAGRQHYVRYGSELDTEARSRARLCISRIGSFRCCRSICPIICAR